LRLYLVLFYFIWTIHGHDVVRVLEAKDQ